MFTSPARDALRRCARAAVGVLERASTPVPPPTAASSAAPGAALPRASPATSRFSHDEAAVARGDPTWAILTPVISDQVSIPDGVVGDVVEIGCEVGDVVEEGHVSVIIETHKGTNAERDARADAMAIRVILERGSRETARSFRSPPSPT